MKALKILGGIVLLIVMLPILAGLSMRAMREDVPPPGQMVDVGGYKLHINCVGPVNDLPTVVLETGAGEASALFHWIQKGISETTRVCAYDRAGLGWSEESGLPRDSKTVNEALHTLLIEANIKRPFVYVGHSVAGLYGRDYIERYPDEVIGLALLDPSHPDQSEAMNLDSEKLYPFIEEQISSLQTLISLGFTDLFGLLKQGRDYELMLEYPAQVQKQLAFLQTKTETYDAFLAEHRDFENAARQAGLNKTLGDMPLVIISAGTPQMAEGWPDGLDSNEITRILMELHGDMEDLSSNSARAIIKPADHMSIILNKDYAEQTIPYIRDVILRAAEKPHP